MTPPALDWGKRWYEEWEADKKTNPLMLSTRTASFIARKSTHLHKLAMVLAATKRDTMIIDVQDMKEANKALLAVEKSLPKVFSRVNLNSGNSAMSAVPTMLNIVVKLGKIDKKKLYQELFNTYRITSADYDTLLKSALDAGEIELEKLGYTTYVSPTTAEGSGIEGIAS